MPTCSKCKKDLEDSSFVGKNGKHVKQCSACRERAATYDSNPERKEKKKEAVAERAANLDIATVAFPCTGCARKSLKAEDFIGKDGKVVKTCTHCRAKCARRDAKPERREEKNAYAKATGHMHSKKYREKKREDNEEEYLRHNAEIHRKWCLKNKDKVSKWSAANSNRKLLAAKASAEAKKIVWGINDELAKEMMTMACFYCDCEPSDETHGITRLDTSLPFTEDNCISSCKTCTFMKKSLDAQTFIERCRHISARFDGPGEDHVDVLSNSVSVPMDRYRQRAERMGLCFELSDDEFDAVVSSDCHYCGKSIVPGIHTNGIDRMDNALGYTKENCVACCGNCNFSKGELSVDDFVGKCKMIASAEHDDLNISSRCMDVVV